MERFYDGDQEKLFAEARVINPFRKGPLISRNRSSQSSLVNTCNLLCSYILSLTNCNKECILTLLIYNSPKERQMGQRNVESVL